MPKTELRCYAPGCGSLHFVWSTDGKASGRRVTGKQALAHLNSKDERHLLDTGWFPIDLDGQWQLVKRHERVGPNRLRVLEKAWGARSEGEPDVAAAEFDYSIDVEDYFYKENVTIRQDCLTVRFSHPVIGDHEVKNWSIKAAMSYWLTNEARIERWLNAHPWPSLDEVLRAPELRHVGSGI